MIKENSENCVCKMLHIGINEPIQSFAIVEDIFENSVCKTPLA